MATELTDLERLRLIVKALRDCGQRPTLQAVSEQFLRETGRRLSEPSTPSDPPKETP